MTVETRPDLSNSRADVVVVGGGPAGMHLVDVLKMRNGSSFKPILIEQAKRLGGSGSASMQQARTLQDDKNLVDMIVRTKDWYERISDETGQNLIYPLPYLFIAADEKQLLQHTASLDQVKKWGHGKDGEILTLDELHRRYPFIDKEVAGALLYPEAFQLDFEAAVNYITKKTPNATFALDTKMVNVKIDKGKVTGVETSQGFISTEKVVLATGPFSINTNDYIIGGTLLEGKKVRNIVTVKKRQRFSAPVEKLPKNLGVFVIAPDGQYVRLTTGEDGSGCGDYGYANPEDPVVTTPLVEPSASLTEFPYIVYAGLGNVISAYGNEEFNGPLAVRPLPESGAAGYYTETPDDLPIVCETSVGGLYLNTAHSHAGVMSRGAAENMANIVENGNNPDNPFRIDREFTEAGIKL